MANKFGCVALKIYLEAEMIDKRIIGLHNAVNLLLLGDSHTCALLREAAFDFIIQNRSQLFDTEQWELLSDSKELLQEVLKATCAEHNMDNNEAGVAIIRKKLGKRKLDLDGTKDMISKRLQEAQDAEDVVVIE